MAFEVYINIFEGINLKAVEKNGSDAFVEVYVGAAKRKVIATPVISGSVNPKWNGEYCLQVPSLAEVLLFQVVHHNTFFKNVPMGEASVDLSKLTALEIGAELRLSLGASFGEMRVLLRAVPLGVCDFARHYHAEPYAPFRLHLERYVYFPGELVCGNIIYNVHDAKARKVDWIHLEAQGKTHLEFRTPQGFGAPGRTDFASKSYVSTFEYNWYAVRAVVAGQSSDGKGEKENLQPGAHMWAFDFALPSRLPPTYTRQSFWSAYTFNVLVQVNGRVETITKDIAIVPFLGNIRPSLTASPILSAVAAAPPLYNGVASSSNQAIGSGMATVTWECPDIVVIGEPFQVKFQVVNQTDSAFVKIGVHLRTIRIYNIFVETQGGWLANKFTEELASAFLGAQCPAGGYSVGGEATLLAPLNITNGIQASYPSVPDSMFPELMQVHHYLEVVSVKTDGVSTISCGRYPVFLTNRQFLPPTGAQFPLKLAPPNCNPCVVRVSRLNDDHVMPLAIPLGPWNHPDFTITQGRSLASVPNTSNTSLVLSTEHFEKNNAVIPLQAAALPSAVREFPLGVPTAIKVSHEEDATAPARPRQSELGSGQVSVNSNFGINLSYQPVSLNQLLNSSFK